MFAFICSAKGRACFLQTYSKGEKELCQYIKSLYSGEILENTRKFIGGKELDIYLPELKLAFEYNGEYWHKIHEEKEPGYHENKRNQCIERGNEPCRTEADRPKRSAPL